MTRNRKGILIRIAAAAALGMAGCATVPETALPVPEVEGDEEEVVCSGACEEEWGRAEEWIKKYSGYPFPAEVTVTPDRIEAARLPMRDCESVPQTRRSSLCPDLPRASEPLGFGEPFERSASSSIPMTYADGGPHWTFLVVRLAEEGGPVADTAGADVSLGAGDRRLRRAGHPPASSGRLPALRANRRTSIARVLRLPRLGAPASGRHRSPQGSETPNVIPPHYPYLNKDGAPPRKVQIPRGSYGRKWVTERRGWRIVGVC